jgi:NADPH:quinone reductase-like Zn-dependent oxidoreductase
MRAVVHDRYGPPEVLRVADVERPVPKGEEVLVRVDASTVTRTDTGLRSAEYPFTRLSTGVRRPKRRVAGMEFAGRVEDVGAAVTEFHVGDEVFGIEGGANAEYVTVRESGVIAQKPTGLRHEEAAAVPDGSLLALTCLRPADPLRAKRVLVYGAAGSIGTAAVQLLAHHFGAEVTAVCDTKDVELVGSLGSRDVLDRFREDFTKNGETYDVIFDAVGKHSFRRCRRSLKPHGIYITLDLGFMYHVPLVSLMTRFVGSRRAKLGIGRYRRDDLLLSKDLVETGKYRPVIDRTYALDEVVEATRYVESGQKTGNVVLRVSEVAPDEQPEPAAKDEEAVPAGTRSTRVADEQHVSRVAPDGVEPSHADSKSAALSTELRGLESE